MTKEETPLAVQISIVSVVDVSAAIARDIVGAIAPNKKNSMHAHATNDRCAKKRCTLEPHSQKFGASSLTTAGSLCQTI
jgi:hypothetical protein